ncbi:MAG: radical SAM protein [Desulfobacterales bacterium]|nr:radical SAM protein [Desulfobacterales bacterium]
MTISEPRYRQLYASGELAARRDAALEQLKECRLCPRACGRNRVADEAGFCCTGSRAKVASYSPHFGEEGPLVGTGGSGTIFFSNCNLGCVFCQNYEISHLGEGVEVDSGQLAAIMLSLEKQGCHNINFVTPSHLVPQILASLVIAAEHGLSLPLVYNSGGYDSVATLRLLDGVIDIYMPDFKFWDPATGMRYTKAPDYPDRARAAIREMHRQVGDLVIDDRGLAVQGLLVRHLVMPGGLDQTGAILGFLARDISKNTYVNVMDQYRPCGRADEFPPLDRRTSRQEYEQALALAREAGLIRLDRREWSRMLYQLASVDG